MCYKVKSGKTFIINKVHVMFPQVAKLLSLKLKKGILTCFLEE